MCVCQGLKQRGFIGWAWADSCTEYVLYVHTEI